MSHICMSDVTHMYECGTCEDILHEWRIHASVAYCLALYHTTSRCHSLQMIATNCNTLQQTARAYHTRRIRVKHSRCNRLQQTATDCNRLQQIAINCNRLQQTALHITHDMMSTHLFVLVHASITCSNWAPSLCVYASHKLSCSSTRDMTHPYV